MHLMCLAKSDLIFSTKLSFHASTIYNHVQVTYDALPTKERKEKRNKAYKVLGA